MTDFIRKAMAEYRRGEATEAATYRAIVGHPLWHVPIDASQTSMLFEQQAFVGPSWSVPFDPTRHESTRAVATVRVQAAMLQPAVPKGRACTFREVSGVEIAKTVHGDGIGFELNTPEAILVASPEGLAALRRWAGAIDVEAALEHPGDDQAGRFLDHDWWVLTREGEARVFVVAGQRVIHIFTASDRVRALLDREPSYEAEATAASMSGRSLFAELAGRADYDGVVINRSNDFRWLLSPEAALAMAEGRDLRPEARVLPARTVAEIHLFLDQMGMPHDQRSHRMVYRGDRLVAEYSGPTYHNESATYAFDPVTPASDPEHLGDGVSQILCAGRLASVLFRRLSSYLPGDVSQWGDREYGMATEARRWAVELEKMLDPETDLLPRRHIRTVFGAMLLREEPEIRTGEFVRQALTWLDDLLKKGKGVGLI